MGYWESNLHKSLRSKNDNATRQRAKDRYQNGFLKPSKNNGSQLAENPGIELTLEERKVLELRSKKKLRQLKESNEIFLPFVFSLIFLSSLVLCYFFFF